MMALRDSTTDPSSRYTVALLLFFAAFTYLEFQVDSFH